MGTEERNRLVEANLGLVGYVLNTFYPSFGRNQDMYQEGCLALVRAAEAFDAGKGVFSTFACCCIRNRFRQFLRGDRRQGRFEREQATGALFLDKLENPPVECTIDIDRAVYEALLGLCRPERAAEVMSMRMEGKTLKEIAEVMGFSRERARQIYEECLAAMRDDPELIERARREYEATGRVERMKRLRKPPGHSPSTMKRNSRIERGLCPDCAQPHQGEQYTCANCRLKSKQRRQR